uniref:Centrosomal protein 128 n=1 Tax=Echeneis naucrates TaxID=173247 RepID=A0A665W0R1_ECHNA
MDTSSESDSYNSFLGPRARGREVNHRPSRARDRARASGNGGDGGAADISKKMTTLANTLQDTSRNLNKVDRMLGHYREHTDDQAEAMALVGHLFSSTHLHTNNVDEGQRFYPTSPLKDYTSTPARRRRSQSAGVRFKDSGLRGEDIHSLHQSLRDLRTKSAHQYTKLLVSHIRLRAQLCKVSILGEVEELKRALERKERERVRLNLQVEVSKKRIGSVLLREMETLLQESTRSRDELKNRAQEAVCQWRAKCKRLQKELEKTRAEAQFHTDKELQLKALSQQTEAARRELAEILGRLAQREEELHRKDMELSETRQRQLSLEQEIREEETRRLVAIQVRLREDNQRLEEQTDAHAHRCRRDQDTQAELQAALKQTTSARAQLAQQLAEEENSKKELQKGVSELQAKLTMAQEERAALGKQLHLEREVHQKELDNMKAMIEDNRIKKDREVQDTLQLYRQERDEMQALLKEVKVVSEKELCGVLRVKLDRMKDECDKLATQLNTKDEAHALLHRKYHLLKQELDDKVRIRHVFESELEEKVLQMEAEKEAILTSMGEELDAACRSLARNGEDKLQTKLRWLCEEVRERDTREQRLRKQHQQTRDQMKALRQSRDSEQAALLQRLDNFVISELLEKSRRKEEEMRSLQVRIMSLLILALDHLEMIPEKQCLMENFKDLEESQRQRETVEQRYTKYKEIVWNLQHQLDDSKRKIQEYRKREWAECLNLNCILITISNINSKQSVHHIYHHSLIILHTIGRLSYVVVTAVT